MQDFDKKIKVISKTIQGLKTIFKAFKLISLRGYFIASERAHRNAMNILAYHKFIVRPSLNLFLDISHVYFLHCLLLK